MSKMKKMKKSDIIKMLAKNKEVMEWARDW